MFLKNHCLKKDPVTSVRTRNICDYACLPLQFTNILLRVTLYKMKSQKLLKIHKQT